MSRRVRRTPVAGSAPARSASRPAPQPRRSPWPTGLRSMSGGRQPPGAGGAALFSSGGGHPCARPTPRYSRALTGIEASNAGSAEAFVTQQLGAGAPVHIIGGTHSGPRSGKGLAGKLRKTEDGPLYGGQSIAAPSLPGRIVECTIGAGAKEPGKKKANNEQTYNFFVLTAGHCDRGQVRWGRHLEEGESPKDPFGTMTRDSLLYPTGGGDSGFATDIAAIALDNGVDLPREILPNSGSDFVAVRGVAPFAKHVPMCVSGGASGRVSRGQGNYESETRWEFLIGGTEEGEDPGLPAGQVRYLYEPQFEVTGEVINGDSGSPVYRCASGELVGLDSWGFGSTGVGIVPFLPLAEPRERPLCTKYSKDRRRQVSLMRVGWGNERSRRRQGNGDCRDRAVRLEDEEYSGGPSTCARRVSPSR